MKLKIQIVAVVLLLLSSFQLYAQTQTSIDLTLGVNLVINKVHDQLKSVSLHDHCNIKNKIIDTSKNI